MKKVPLLEIINRNLLRNLKTGRFYENCQLPARKICQYSLLIALFFITSYPLFSQSKLERKAVLDGKISLLIPESLELMSKEAMAGRFPPGRVPTLAFCDEGENVFLSVNLTVSPADNSVIPSYLGNFKPMFKGIYPTADWLEDGVKNINGKQVGFMEFTAPDAVGDVYTYFFFTDCDNKLLICTFNCPIEESEEWSTIAEEIINSLIVK